MKILLTGATGFIGKHLLNALLTEGNEVLCLVRESSDVSFLGEPGVTLKTGSLLEPKTIEAAFAGIDVVIHLAGQVGAFGIPYQQFYEINCQGTINILKLAEAYSVKQMIYCSTPGVLGFGKRLAPEEAEYAPRNDYEITKMIAEKSILDFCKNAKIRYTIIRPDFVYGPGDVRRIKMYSGIKNGKFLLTTSGKSYLHPTYIDDVVQGFMRTIMNQAAFNQIFNIAAEHDITSKEYLDIIAKNVNASIKQINIGYRASVLLGSMIDKVYKRFLRREAFVSKNKIDFLAIDHSSSIEKAKKLLKYQPEYDCKKGMEKTIQWLKEQTLL